MESFQNIFARILFHCHCQRWSRGPNVRGQGQELKKVQGQRPTFRGQTLSMPRIEMLEAKDTNFRDRTFSA